MGVESDKDILEYIFNDFDDEVNKELIDEMIPSVKDGSIIYTKEGALKYLTQFTT